MSPIQGVHHINLLVADLEAAVERWRAVMGNREPIIDDLPTRGVRTARFEVGDTWIVLVQPVAEGEPMRILRERGEGLFLLSLSVDSIDACRGSAPEASGLGQHIAIGETRPGLQNWLVADLDACLAPGAIIQLTELGPLTEEPQ